MLLTLATDFRSNEDTHFEVLACNEAGAAIMRVRIDLDEFHPITYELLDAPGLMFPSVALVIGAAARLVDALMTGYSDSTLYTVEV